MEITKIINGYEYTFEVFQNWITAEEICKETNAGYKLSHKTNNLSSKIIKTNTMYFEENIPKHIGTLICNPETNQLTLFKYVDMEKHHFIVSDSFGINQSIMKHLRASDRILIETSENKTYSISVEKALKVGQYLHFNRYELQIFIHLKDFMELEIKKKKRFTK